MYGSSTLDKFVDKHIKKIKLTESFVKVKIIKKIKVQVFLPQQ